MRESFYDKNPPNFNFADIDYKKEYEAIDDKSDNEEIPAEPEIKTEEIKQEENKQEEPKQEKPITRKAKPK